MEVEEDERQMGTFQQRGMEGKISIDAIEDGKTEEREDSEEEKKSGEEDSVKEKDNEEEEDIEVEQDNEKEDSINEKDNEQQEDSEEKDCVKEKDSEGKEDSEEEEGSEEEESQEERRIKICFLNASGCKNKDHKFWDYIDKFDIVGIVETWVTEKQAMEFNKSLRKTFRWKHQLATKEFPEQKGRGKGGILTGVKCHIEENEVDIEEVEGIQERRPIIGKDEWRILTIYSQNMNRTRIHLEDMVRFTESRKVIIGGDFNARTGTKGTNIWGSPESEQPRKSKDRKKCTNGNILIEMVDENAWSIMNGNVKGEEGEFTNITAQGNSVIDYVIVNVKARDKTMNFQVDCTEFVQGHRPLIIEIENQDQAKNCDQVEEECERRKLKQIENEDHVWEYINAEKETRIRTSEKLENNFSTDKKEETATEITEEEIRNQMAKLNIEETVDINKLKVIINRTWRGIFPEIWWEPINRKGGEHETNRFKGIITMKSLYIIYAMCLKEKLETELKTKGIIPQTQSAFEDADGTINNIFILNYVIQMELEDTGGEVYAFFVKLTAAFDTVDRKELERMLETNGISQTLRTRIRTTYTGTETINGLRQGCPLSPILFSLYIADLESDMQKVRIEGIEVPEIQLRSFVNEDSIVLIAKRSQELSRLMKKLHNYLLIKNLDINFEKSKVLVFTKNLFRKQGQWRWGERDIDEVHNYEYFKFYFDKSGTWNTHAKETAKRAMVAMAHTWDIGKRKFGDNIKERMMMFNALIGNILLYGAEIWGSMEMREIEKVQEKYIRLMLEEVIGERIENISTEARKRAKEYAAEVYTRKKARRK